ncbi:uncharacterized protein ACMZJ9_000347 [Mantella aurantiaca]
MCEAYKVYFGMPVGDQDKSWAPHVTCEYCKKTLEGWYRGEKRAMKFAIPRIWREPTFPNQKDINDLIRDLGLTKSNAELLISRLKQWNLLDESVQVTEQRSRHQTVSIFFRIL